MFFTNAFISLGRPSTSLSNVNKSFSVSFPLSSSDLLLDEEDDLEDVVSC
jgi:hypothetical protein